MLAEKVLTSNRIQFDGCKTKVICLSVANTVLNLQRDCRHDAKSIVREPSSATGGRNWKSASVVVHQGRSSSVDNFALDNFIRLTISDS
jgi:hypothetical protein